MAQVLREFIGLEYDAKQIKEARAANESIILSGILQRADALNQNGRLYPRSILEREVNNYQKAVAEGRAVGECVPPGTEIFTPTGWRNIEDVITGDHIFTLNKETEAIEIQPVLDTVHKKYKDDLIRIYNCDSVDMTLTKNHKVILWDNSNEIKELTAEELFDRLEKRDSTIHTWKLKREKFFHLIGTTNVFCMDDAYIKQEKVPFDGDVFCVRVENGTWLMRQNNAIAWTSNCDHPDKSVVELKNVSHVIREIGWRNNDVIGKVEILGTPSGNILKSLMESGIRLGISSRGVGEVQKNDEGNDVVDESFVLICFDVVSEPSTHGAWLGESKNIDIKEVYSKLSRRDRVNRIVNAILGNQ